MNKQAQLIDKLGDHMTESAGGKLVVDDRFSGFVPSDATSGEMSLDRIMEDVDQPRKTYDEEALQQLADNLKSHGVQQPIQLRWNDDHKKWLIVYGHRRYRAARLAGLDTIPCTFISEDVDEPTIRVRQLVENCQREDLQPMEMARAIDALALLTGWSNRHMAKELGFADRTIGRYRDLLKLPEELKQSVDEGELPASVANEVLRLKDQVQQKNVGREIIERKLNRNDAKQKVDEALQVAGSTLAERPKAKQHQLFFQTPHITVYRHPDTHAGRIQQELLKAAAELDPERSEA